MAKETITKCDGCAVPEGADPFWQAKVEVAWGSAASQPRSGLYELCPKCGARLLEVTNPTTWPRKVRKLRKAA